MESPHTHVVVAGKCSQSEQPAKYVWRGAQSSHSVSKYDFYYKDTVHSDTTKLKL